MKTVLGIDPGASGGYCLMQDNKIIKLCKFVDFHETNQGIAAIIKTYPETKAVIEKVHAMPGQGVTSMFSFGMNFGFWHGILIAHQIPFSYVSPQKWQKLVGNLPAEKADRKRALRDMAKNHYPEFEKLINLNTADAVWIAKTSDGKAHDDEENENSAENVMTVSEYESIEQVKPGDLVIIINIKDSNKIGNVISTNIEEKTVYVQLLNNKTWTGSFKKITAIQKN